MTTKCWDQEFPCQNYGYPEFDSVAQSELQYPITAVEFVNKSDFCTMIPTDKNFQLGSLTHKSYLKRLQKKTGIYHLWIDYDNCDDHETFTMQCVYVGKGIGSVRIDEHIRKKWPNNFTLYVTFTECENRLSKYYEQLFLDTYDIALNKNENPGAKKLFAVWSDELHRLGTEICNVSALSEIQTIDDI